MSGSAYMKRLRARRAQDGECERCGEPHAGTGRCPACRVEENFRSRDRRRLARIGLALVPKLKTAVSRCEVATVTPSEAKRLLAIRTEGDRA